jgi:hypothetical protein
MLWRAVMPPQLAMAGRGDEALVQVLNPNTPIHVALPNLDTRL